KSRWTEAVSGVHGRVVHRHGIDRDRDLRMVVSRLEGVLLPGRSPSTPTARSRDLQFRHGRAQPDLLQPRELRHLPPLARRGTAGLPLRREGKPLHHPQQEARRRGNGLGQLLRIRGLGPGRSSRPVPVAIAACSADGSGAARALSGCSTSAYPVGSTSSPRSRRSSGRPEVRDCRVLEAASQFDGVTQPRLSPPEVGVVLLRHRVALAFSHPTDWPYTEEITADFVYLRLHRPEALYDSGYGEEALKGWAERILAWSRGDEPEDAHRITDWPPPPAGSRDVFVYFDNDGHAHAPHDALALRRLVHEARQNSI